MHVFKVISVSLTVISQMYANACRCLLKQSSWKEQFKDVLIMHLNCPRKYALA